MKRLTLLLAIAATITLLGNPQPALCSSCGGFCDTTSGCLYIGCGCLPDYLGSEYGRCVSLN